RALGLAGGFGDEPDRGGRVRALSRAQDRADRSRFCLDSVTGLASRPELETHEGRGSAPAARALGVSARAFLGLDPADGRSGRARPRARLMAKHVVAAAADIPPGTRKLAQVNGRAIVVFNLGGEFFALNNRCPHRGGSLFHGKQTGLVESDGPGNYR